MLHAWEVELDETVNLILGEVDRIRPSRVVFDSLSELRLLAQDSLRYRRQILALKHYFARQNATDREISDIDGLCPARIVYGPAGSNFTAV